MQLKAFYLLHFKYYFYFVNYFHTKIMCHANHTVLYLYFWHYENKLEVDLQKLVLYQWK